MSAYDPKRTSVGHLTPILCSGGGVTRYDGFRKPRGTMRRREFIALVGGAAAIWPLTALAQQSERIRRVGVLEGIPEDPYLAAFVQRLQQLGWVDGRNVRIETRWGGGNIDNIRKHAAELSGLAPDVI